MEPAAVLVSDRADLGQVVKGHAGSGAQSGRDEERDESHGSVLLHGLGQGGSAEAQVLVRVQDAELDEGDHGRLLHAGVSLFGAVADELGEEDTLVHEGVHGFELLDLLGASGQEGDEDALAGGGLHHAATLAALREGEEIWGQADHLAEPIQNDRLQLSANGTSRLKEKSKFHNEILDRNLVGTSS